MDNDRFDRLTRTLAATPTRRGLTHGLTGPIAVSALGVAWPVNAAAKKKNKKKKKPCSSWRFGRRCNGLKPDETPCNGDGKCFRGECIPRLTCRGILGSCSVDDPEICCSGGCVPALGCSAGDAGDPCFGARDCASIDLACIAYRCRQRALA